jgi:hydroxypyruvate reductase
MGLNPQEALEKHDAYTFFSKIDALVKTGPTNTNVMDIQIAIIDI